MNRSEFIEIVLGIGAVLSFSITLVYIVSSQTPDYFVGLFGLFVVPMCFGILNGFLQERLE